MELEQAKALAKALISDDEMATREKAFALYAANRDAFAAYQEKRNEKIKALVKDMDANDAEVIALKAAADATESEWKGFPAIQADPMTTGDWDAMGNYVETPSRCILTGAILFESDDVIVDDNGCILRKVLPLPDLPPKEEEKEEEYAF